jgi:crotonobetainyl-CoA:carnitine CoA-transferase CaiB-like acyl-CoA transferase
MLREADIFVESLSPRAVRELGLQFAKVRQLNRKIVYCSIKGFSSDSASSQRVGFDTIAQAEGALMHVARSESGRPSRVGNPCVDLSAASFGAVGILSALLSKPRKATYIEVPIYDVVVYWNGYWMPYIDLRGSEPSQLASSHPGFSPYGVFTTEDGFVFIGVLADSHWSKLTARLNIPDDGRYSAMKERIAAREDVNRLVQEALKQKTTDQLLNLLGEDVPCARVSTLMDVYHDEELRKRGVVRRVRLEGRSVSVALPPFPRWRKPMRMARPRPLTPRRPGARARPRRRDRPASLDSSLKESI